MLERIKIKNESKKRIRSLEFGEPVTNICAGPKNPMRHCWFVQNKGSDARCTDKKGTFWDIGIEVIHRGHLAEDKCKELFEPVWDSQYGS